MTEFKPFADDVVAISIGAMTVENCQDRVSLSGMLDITRDRKGLALLEALKVTVDEIHQVLVSDTKLPDAISIDAPKHAMRKNPFA